MSEAERVQAIKDRIGRGAQMPGLMAAWCNRKGWHTMYIGTNVCIDCGTEPWGRPIRHIPVPADHGQA